MNYFEIEEKFLNTYFTKIIPRSGLRLDLRYCSDNHFMKRPLYHGKVPLFLAPLAAKKFEKAITSLEKSRPDLEFVIWDGLRPTRVQKEMYECVANTPYQSYVANPNPGSLHNFGMAIDLTLGTKGGPLLDMGTDFDDFSDLARPELESQLLKLGQLTLDQIKNRKILRSVLEEFGFKVLPHEWWHFNAESLDKVIEQGLVRWE